jgi:hypothetical protein
MRDDERLHLVDSNPGSTRQGINPDDRDLQLRPASKIECGAGS